MFEFITETEERGQVGIGTLIVFIAMVLVAAIAAGVLINTADFLQEKSQQTGEESTNQVTNTLDVVSVVGVSGDTDGDTINDIETVKITVKRSPGADAIDLTETTLVMAGADGQVQQSVAASSIMNIKDADGNVLDKDADRAMITIDLTAFYGTIAEGEEARISLVTASGGKRVIEVRGPNPMPASGEAVSL